MFLEIKRDELTIDMGATEGTMLKLEKIECNIDTQVKLLSNLIQMRVIPKKYARTIAWCTNVKLNFAAIRDIKFCITCSIYNIFHAFMR